MSSNHSGDQARVIMQGGQGATLPNTPGSEASNEDWQVTLGNFDAQVKYLREMLCY